MLHKTYLAICSGANKSVREGWKSSLSGKDASCLENFGLPLGAKLLRLAPKSLTSHDATNTQIGATSTQLAKRVEGICICPSKGKSKMSSIAKVPDWDAFLFERIYSEYVWNFDNAIEGMYLRTTVQLSRRRQREIRDGIPE